MSSAAPTLSLLPKDRDQLEAWTQSRQTPERIRVRCQIVLAAAEGCPNTLIARRLRVTRPTVIAWRKRFQAGGPQALLDEGVQSSPSGTRVSRPTVWKVMETLNQPSADARPWTIRKLAIATGMSSSSIQRIWQTQGIRPHVLRRFLPAKDPSFPGRLLDVVGAYFHPPYHALLLAVTPEPIGLIPKTTSAPMGHFFVMLRLLNALRASEGYFTHVPFRFLRFLEQAALRTPEGVELYLVADIWEALADPRVKGFLAQHLHVRLLSLPEEASWDDLMRWWLQPLLAHHLAEGRVPAFLDLERALNCFLNNGESDPFEWIGTYG